MGVKLSNWNGVGHMFEFKIPLILEEQVNSAVEQVAQIYSHSIMEVFEEQPGGWTEKSESWTEASGSWALFRGKQGQFIYSVTNPNKNRRGFRAKRGDKKVFVGARYDVVHHSGFTMATMAEILQATPDYSRDLFQTAYDRVEDRINQIFRQVGVELK